MEAEEHPQIARAMANRYRWPRVDAVTRRTFFSAAAAGCGVLTGQAQTAGKRDQVTDALSAFGSQARQMLLATMDGKSFRGQIPPATVSELLRLEHKNADDLMLALLPLARTCAHPPLSKFLVGAVVRGDSGSLYLGANIEIPGHTLGSSVHAEQASLANAYMSGEEAVTAIAVTGAPCGHCRQFLNEMSTTGDIRVLVSGAPPTTLSTLLPMAFGPRDMGFKQGALPVKQSKLSLPERSADALALRALDAAEKSYSPYTSSLSGIAVSTKDQRVFAGSYIENAAFNPSLSPLQVALAGLFAARRGTDELVRAVLVQAAGAKISQESATRAVLASSAPAARIEVLTAKP